MALEQQPELRSQFPTRGRQRTEQQLAEAEHGTAALLWQQEQGMVKNLSLDGSGGSWTELMPLGINPQHADFSHRVLTIFMCSSTPLLLVLLCQVLLTSCKSSLRSRCGPQG